MSGNLVNPKVDKLLNFTKSSELVSSWTKFDILDRLTGNKNQYKSDFEHSKLLAFLYQGAGLKSKSVSEKDAKLLLSRSYDMWKVIWVSEEIGDCKQRIKQLFHLVCTGLLVDSFAEVRMLLKDAEIEKWYSEISKEVWPEFLEYSIYSILLILIRKKDGWRDISLVDNIINNLQKVQEEVEEAYYVRMENSGAELEAIICWIGALFNLLESVEVYKKYMINGKPDDIENVVIRLCRDALDLIEYSTHDDERYTVNLIEMVIIKLVTMSIWSNVYGISEKIDKYVEMLTLSSNDRPIFELWPSQQKAISTNLFDNTKTAVVVQMPTSAGKTLLSKFYILQTLNLYNDAKIAYIVPTRALVNQVKRDIKHDFKDLDKIKVGISVPYSDVDEIEDKLLLQDIDIVVTTPEKLDILMRTKHPIVEKLRLVVVDEAHSIQDKNRGARLELLLAMLRKHNRNLKVLMLSPFMSNASGIASWLGGSRGHNIYVDWKPSQQFAGVHELETIKRGEHASYIEYIPTALNTMYNEKFRIPIGKFSKKDESKIVKSYVVAKTYKKLGGVLVLCTQRGYAEKVAGLCLELDDIDSSRLKKLTPLLELIEQEMGNDCLLYKCIRKGVAYHHSSLPLIIREEIEEAIGNRLIDIVAATTTLAQGMNFPISTVIFQGMNISEDDMSRPMKPCEFWNIAGRAGRALTDKEGHIIAVVNDTGDRSRFEEYLQKKNQEVLSSLWDVIKILPENGIDEYWLERYQELSSLLQYIYHIMLVDRNIEIQDILRGSLVYSQLNDSNESQLAEKLVRIANNYIKKISPDLKREKLMESIDKTGLSSVSMHKLMRNIRKEQSLELNLRLFDNNNHVLKDIINIVNDIPEIKLSVYNKGEFDSELVEKITKDWVNGKSVREIAENNFQTNKQIKTIDDKMQLCGKYIYSTLINNLPWGISAVQRAKGIITNSDIKETGDDTLIPSYIYFGTNDKESIAFSMLGVPRFAVKTLGRRWREEYGEVNLDNLSMLQNWLNDSTEENWRKYFDLSEQNKAKIAYSIWKKQNG